MNHSGASHVQGGGRRTSTDLNTLDEPVTATIYRDMAMICRKFYQVLVPRSSSAGGNNLLRDWDLWGPLVLCVTLAMLLRDSAPDNQKVLVFSGVFVIVWCGAGVVTLNSQLLGGKLSFFQSLCVLGYCILPLVCAAGVGKLLGMHWLNVPVVAVGFGWSIFASHAFLTNSQPADRKGLVNYPIILFYLVIAFMILLQKAKVSIVKGEDPR
eukprot:Nk52_evm6s1779 gene=Nk52_evmTU6s1779